MLQVTHWLLLQMKHACHLAHGRQLGTGFQCAGTDLRVDLIHQLTVDRRIAVRVDGVMEHRQSPTDCR